MSKNFFKKSGLVALVGTLLGCTQKYPQYSGKYKLDITGVEYAPEDFKGEKKWPGTLEIVHRMEYYGSGFNHYLGFEFEAGDNDEAEGRNSFKLSRLTAEGREAYPNETPDGERVYEERRIYGGAFCNSQVQYWVFARVFPDHKLLDEVYESHVGTIGKDPVTGMDIKISPSPSQLEEQFNEEKADEWFELAERGASIEITILRHLDSTTDGCYQNGGYLPPDKWGEAWSKARYYSIGHDYDTNIITAGLGDLEKFDGLEIEFFRQIIPDVGSTDY